MNPPIYNIGDKFISLVNYQTLYYGQLLTINGIAPEYEALTYRCQIGNSGLLWGFSKKSLEFTTIPICALTEKELFIYTLSGIPSIPEKILTEPQKNLVYRGY